MVGLQVQWALGTVRVWDSGRHKQGRPELALAAGPEGQVRVSRGRTHRTRGLLEPDQVDVELKHVQPEGSRTQVVAVVTARDGRRDGQVSSGGC